MGGLSHNRRKKSPCPVQPNNSTTYSSSLIPVAPESGGRRASVSAEEQFRSNEIRHFSTHSTLLAKILSRPKPAGDMTKCNASGGAGAFACQPRLTATSATGCQDTQCRASRLASEAGSCLRICGGGKAKRGDSKKIGEGGRQIPLYVPIPAGGVFSIAVQVPRRLVQI